MRIAMTGSSGFVGSALRGRLEEDGHEVVRLMHPKDGRKKWDLAPLEGCDAVVNLAGANIAAKRWTDAFQRVLYESRVTTTRHLVEAIRNLDQPPAVLVSASAVGYYGQCHRPLDEQCPKGRGFLADLAHDWESVAIEAASDQTRVVIARIGVVLGPGGGAMAKMLPLFRFGLGGVLNGGGQRISWISLEDLVSAIVHLMETSELEGPVNCVAPQIVSNREFTQTLAKLLHRPAIFRTPGWLLRLLVGKMAEETLLENVEVVPRRLLESGFAFRHATLEEALHSIL